MNIIDFLALIPFYVALLLEGLEDYEIIGKAGKILRLLKVIKREKGGGHVFLTGTRVPNQDMILKVGHVFLDVAMSSYYRGTSVLKSERRVPVSIG